MRTTVYDDVFRTLAQKTPRVFISLINEVFGTRYSGEAKLEQLHNEFYKKEGVVITDSIFKIGKDRYHIECQSSRDGTISIRMVEYDFLIGITEARGNRNYEKVELPLSCVLYLRSSKNTPESLSIRICQEDRSMEYVTKVVRLSDYTSDSIAEKKLLIMIPFFLFNYEKKLKSPKSRDEAMEAALNDCKKLAETLNRLDEKEYTKDELVDLKEAFDKVNSYLFKNDPGIAEEAEKIMGGNVYVTRSEILRKEGREEGREEGRSEGIRGVIDIMLEMNCSETDIISRLMKTFGLSEEEAKTRYDEYAASNVIS